MHPTNQPSAAIQATHALRRVCQQLRDASGPAEVAGLVEEITRDGGTLEALSDALAAAGRWVQQAPGGGHLWQPLALAADDIWQAGADIASAPEQLRSTGGRPVGIHSTSAHPASSTAAGQAPRRR
ncbi:hypothetical protein ACWC5I_07595 [Kitasatospora sp. NPDC001574]